MIWRSNIPAIRARNICGGWRFCRAMTPPPPSRICATALYLNEENPAFRRDFSARIRAILALDVLVLHRRDEARDIAAPACGSDDAEVRAWLKRAALCAHGG